MESKDIMMFKEKYLCTQDGRELDMNRVLKARKLRRTRRESSGRKKMRMSTGHCPVVGLLHTTRCH